MLIDPENGNYQLAEDSPAWGYGCQTFPDGNRYFTVNTRESHTIYPKSFGRSTIEVSGLLSEDTLWEVDTVKVIGDVIIDEFVNLVINPGTKIEFQGYYEFLVLGSIKAIGTPDSLIRFTSYNPDIFSFDDSIEGSWNGIRFNNTSALNDSSRFEYCLFEFSKSINDYEPGGVFYLYNFSELNISNSIFNKNYAHYGGVISCFNNSNPSLVGNLITANYSSVSGSVLFAAFSYPKFINNTIMQNINLNEDSFWATCALDNYISKGAYKNNIIRENNTYFFLGGQLLENKDYYTSYNNIEGYEYINNNIDDDPLFTDFGEYPWSLLQGSPCIDAGDPQISGLPEYDLAGNLRIYNNIVDIGAYEWCPPVFNGQDFIIEPVIQLQQNYPNPFCLGENGSRQQISIPFELNIPSWITLSVYNLKGQRIVTLIDQFKNPGFHTVTWDGRDFKEQIVESGIYFYNLSCQESNISKKLLIIR